MAAIERHNKQYLDNLTTFSSYKFVDSELDKMETQKTSMDKSIEELLNKRNELDERITKKKKEILISEIAKNPDNFLIFPHQANYVLNKLN